MFNQLILRARIAAKRFQLNQLDKSMIKDFVNVYQLSLKENLTQYDEFVIETVDVRQAVWKHIRGIRQGEIKDLENRLAK